MGQGVGLPLQHAPVELDAADDVAPLVAAADLQGAAVAARKFQEVVGLQEHVAELGVGNASPFAVEAGAHRVALHHGVDREVLAHVAQERQHGHVLGPVQVVHQQGRVGAFEFHEARRLGADRFHPAFDDARIVQRTLATAPGRIADQPGCAAEKHDGPMPGKLEPPQHQQRHEIAHLQAGRRGVEAGVDDARRARQVRVQAIAVRDLGKQAAVFERAEQRSHRTKLPSSGSDLHRWGDTGGVRGSEFRTRTPSVTLPTGNRTRKPRSEMRRLGRSRHIA